MKINLGMKLSAGFAVCILIIISVVAYNFLQLGNLKTLQDDGAKRADESGNAARASRLPDSLYKAIADLIINKNVAEFKANWEKDKKAAEDELNLINSSLDTDQEKSWIIETRGYYQKITDIVDNELLPLAANSGEKKDDYDAIVKEMDDRIDVLLENMYKPINSIHESLNKEQKLADAEFDNISTNVIIVSVILAISGIILAIFIAVFITRMITVPINKIVKTANNIADGNLNNDEIQLKSNDEIRLLADSFNKMGDSLNRTLSQVNIAIEQVATGAAQVSAASQSLSQGATEQASSLEEITSSVGEINSQTLQNSENAARANDLSKHAMENAKNGNDQMNGLVNSMNMINKSAQEIKKIVKAIDDIAFQINLLALNANVEAARAGKYGKGFAVVADEVRNLAVRSTGSVKETTTMIEEAARNIESGNRLVEITAKQLEEILDSSSKAADLVEEIANASKEQTQGVEQVNLGLEQVDQVTQSTTASAEECASTAEELASQAQQLRGLMQNFKLRGSMPVKSVTALTPELIALLKNELKKNNYFNNQDDKIHPDKTSKNINEKKNNKGTVLNPKDVISLDDQDFGKF